MERIIVSRHPAAIEFIARELGLWDSPTTHRHCGPPPASGLRWLNPGQGVVTDDALRSGLCSGWAICRGEDAAVLPIPVLASAAANDVRGKIVYGNLPLHLATIAAQVVAIEFAGNPPRGAEYTLSDMAAAGARLVGFCGILSLPDEVTRDKYLEQGGFSV